MAYLVGSKGLSRYVRRYLRIFSWKRLANASQVLMSMLVSWVMRRPVVWGQPFLMMVEPTNFCNLKCPLCPSGNGQMRRPRGNMSIDDFKQLVDQVADRAFMMMMWNQGEPYLNACFNEMVRYAHEKDIFTFTSTNGHYIRTDAEAEAIVDSGLGRNYCLSGWGRSGDLRSVSSRRDIDRVFDGVHRLVEAKKRRGVEVPLVNLQFIVMRHNEQDMAAAEAKARELGVDKFLVKTAQVYTDTDAETFLPENQAFSRYEEGEDELVVKGQPVRGCKVLWYSSMINWNGDVAPCCFDKDVDFGMGQAFGKTHFALFGGGSLIWISALKYCAIAILPKCVATVQRDIAVCFLW